jgi:hypothetical protein
MTFNPVFNLLLTITSSLALFVGLFLASFDSLMIFMRGLCLSTVERNSIYHVCEFMVINDKNSVSPCLYYYVAYVY